MLEEELKKSREDASDYHNQFERLEKVLVLFLFLDFSASTVDAIIVIRLIVK